MKNFIEADLARNLRKQMLTDISDITHLLPNFRLNSVGEISDEFLRCDLTDFHSALNFVWRLPYGRNSDRADFRLVLNEMRGTCATKHALLAALTAEYRKPIFLTLGIYEMNARNTPRIGAVLDEFGLTKLPEAHCYLTFQNERIDVTRFSEAELEPIVPIESFLYEEQICPDQIGEYKVVLHSRFFQNWMRGKKIGKSFEDLWIVREKCIAALTLDV